MKEIRIEHYNLCIFSYTHICYNLIHHYDAPLSINHTHPATPTHL